METNKEVDCDIRKIWIDQESFNKLFFDHFNMTLEQRQQKTKDFVIHLSKECYEILDEIQWKMHRSSSKTVNKDAILEECIDVFKFLMGVMNIWGFTVEEFTAMYWEKSAKVRERYNEEHNIT